MSEICIARPEDILWHCQQACDQQGWERKRHCDSCRGTQASLPAPLTVTLTLLTLNKIYSKEYFSLNKTFAFQLFIVRWYLRISTKAYVYNIQMEFLFCFSANMNFSSFLKAFCINIAKTRIKSALGEWIVAWWFALTWVCNSTSMAAKSYHLYHFDLLYGWSPASS